MTFATGFTVFYLGFCLGMIVMWLYHRRAGHLRSAAEISLSRGLGEGAWKIFVEDLRLQLLNEIPPDEDAAS